MSARNENFITDANGNKHWYLNGELHREDGPAIEHANGDKHWYLNGELHREDGPAVENADGYKHWYLNGVFHREDGPANEYADGSKYWYLNGKRHREDGPAIECADGDKHWYLNGKVVTELEIVKLLKEKFRETAIALLPLKLPPYVLLAMLEFAVPLLATSQHHVASINLLMGLAASRRKINAIKR